MDEKTVFIKHPVKLRDGQTCYKIVFHAVLRQLSQSSYLSRISRIIFVEKNCHVEKFQLTIYDNCGEIENFFTCGEILGNFEKY